MKRAILESLEPLLTFLGTLFEGLIFVVFPFLKVLVVIALGILAALVGVVLISAPYRYALDNYDNATRNDDLPPRPIRRFWVAFRNGSIGLVTIAVVVSLTGLVVYWVWNLLVGIF